MRLHWDFHLKHRVDLKVALVGIRGPHLSGEKDILVRNFGLPRGAIESPWFPGLLFR